MTGSDHSAQLAEQVRTAAAEGTWLAIRGSGSKRFITGELEGTPFDVTAHRGIVSYEPTELVLTVRAGTTLAEIEAVLAEKNQMLAFEPPHFGPGATLGGTVACGLSGPRRPYTGSARDFVLGTKIVNGRGEILNFGGQVMKNVAGYDVSRLMVGSYGTLGVLLEASLKVLPRPVHEITLSFAMGAAEAIRNMNAWAAQPLPLSGAAHWGETLYIRLSGSAAGVRAARAKLGGESWEPGTTLWEELREHRCAFFETETQLWRFSVPPATAPIDLPGTWLLDWGGAQRWLVSNAPPLTIETAAERVSGHAARVRPAGRPVAPHRQGPSAFRQLHARIRSAFDAQLIFNHGLLV